MIQIETPRLTLLALSVSQLDTYASHLPDLSQELGMPISGDTSSPGVQRALQLKLEYMRALPETDHPWFTYWLLIQRLDPAGVGLAGFKGLPNPAGEVSIGYGMDPGHQNKGYMTEAVRFLAGWA
jgi:RimJ/RimL family protein N-acetyltransferase